nr:hypothetical protein [Tanacetum cinerariifolium]
MWYINTFRRVALKWGALLDVDDQEDEHFHTKRICINTNEDESKDGSYEEEPNGGDFRNVEDLEGDSDGEVVPNTKFEEESQKQKDEEVSVRHGNLQSDDPFNIYELLNHKRSAINKFFNSKDSLKYPPGYTPTGCKEATGDKKADSKKKNRRMMLRNPFAQDPNMFKKINSTVSDYFVMVRGDWMPTGKKLLIISVYAPQELIEKKMLWNYSTLAMSNWEGEPNDNRLHMDMIFSNTLNSNQVVDWECQVSKEKIKKAVWDCGIDKSPGLDGFTFGFYHWYWNLLENDVVNAVSCFFHQDSWKEAPIIESNALVRMTKKHKYLKEKIRMWNKLNKKKSQKSKRCLKAELADCVAIIDKGELEIKVFNRRTEVVRLLQELEKMQSLEAAQKAKIKWDIEGDENSKYYHGVINKKRNQLKICGILVEENDVVDAVSCFFHQGSFPNGGICVEDDKVEQAAEKIGCNTLKILFSYLGSNVGGCMSCIQSWNETIKMMADRLSEWKLKTLSIGDRLTLLKYVLGSMPIYHMSIFNVSKKVLQRMESMHSNFLNGVESSSKKVGLGEMEKCFGRFITQGSSLWARVIKALHGDDRKIGKKANTCYPSIWLNIIQEVEKFKSCGIDLVSLIHSKGGVEQFQFELLKEKVEGCILADMMDRWFWASEGSGDFTIASVRKMIDDFMLPEVSSKTHWIKAVPIKVNVHAWKVKLDGLPTRLNISRRVKFCVRFLDGGILIIWRYSLTKNG